MKKPFFKKIIINCMLWLVNKKVNKSLNRNVIMMTITQESYYRHREIYIDFPGKHSSNIMKGYEIYEGIKKSTWFTNVPGIDVILANYLAEIKKYRRAEINVKLRRLSARATRDQIARNFCQIISARIKDVVAGVCYANPEYSEAIAQSAAMKVATPGGRTFQLWSLKRGELAGSMKLLGKIIATKTKRFCFQWQMTDTPENPDSWYFRQNEIIPTLKGSTLVVNLPEGVRYYFRYRVILKDEVTDWSDVLSIIIT